MRWTSFLGVLAGLMPLGPAVADTNNWTGPYHPMMGWGGWFMGPVMMIVVFTLLVVAVLVVARMLGWHAGPRQDAPQDRSLVILRERFARGEIDRQEFDERRKLLE